MRINLYLLFPLILMAFFSACDSRGETIKPLFICSERLDNPYGICTHINKKGIKYEYERRDSDLTMINSLAGVKNIRCGFNWEYCQPDLSKPISYKRFDTMMSSVPDSISVLRILQPLTTSFSVQEWHDYVSSVVRRYHTSGWWEVVNEVNLFYKQKKYFTIDDYTYMLKVAYMTIKKDNPTALVVCGSVSGIKDHYLDSMLVRGLQNYFDIVNIHRYVNKDREPEMLINDFRALGELLEYYHVKKNVWLTETGCSTATGYASEETQAQRLPRVFLISFACGVDKAFWYKSRSNEISDDKEKHFGLWHNDFTPKPSYYAYRTLIQMCPNGSSRPKLKRNGNVYIASWERPDMKKVWAIWSPKGCKDVRLNIIGDFDCYDNNGKVITTVPDTIRVSPSVKYIVGARELLLL